MAEEGGSRIEPGMTKKMPQWVHPFLRALERCGDAPASAADAGIDWSTAYARRRRHPDFDARWVEALEARKRRLEREEAEELEAFNASLEDPSTAFGGPPPRDELGEELSISGGQVRRVGHGRWTRRKEKIFFDELAATANISRSAAAAGVSYNAVLARRLRHRLFREKWDAVVRSAKAVIGMHVLEAGKQTFDPDRHLDLPETMPKVTIAEAIKISSDQGPGRRSEPAEDPFAEDEAASDDDGMDAVRESIIGKLRRIRESDRREQLALGWTLDESFDVMIPPGYIQGPDYKPLPPELPVDYYSNYRMR